MIDHLSYSSINTYLYCPENWRRKYIAEEPVKLSPVLVFGSAFHSTVETLITEGGDSLSIWGEKWAAAQKEQNIYWGEETPEQYYNDGVRMFSNKTLLAEIRKIIPGRDESGAKIERKVELCVPGVPIPIIGYIDVILSDGIPADIKTSARSWTDDQAQDSLQSLFYLAALNQAGIEINWKFQHLIFVKTKEPKFQRLEHSHTKGEIFFLFELIQRVWQGIEKEVFPLNPTTWKCGEKYCDYYANCRGKYQA